MIICKTKSDTRRVIADWKTNGDRIGLVPTMGALHDGHLSLVDIARQNAGRTVATIFVNPLQFAPEEDFDDYPRGFEGDAALLEERGCDLVFAPTHSELFADDFSTRVLVEGVTENYCGAARPHFFEGVATIVTKLLMITTPDVAVFGEKDYQQLATLRRLVRDLDIATEVIGGPIIRETDGLAMSSRNAYLTEKERAFAPKLFRTLNRAAEMLTNEAATAKQMRDWAMQQLMGAGFSSVDYVDLADAASLALIDRADRPARLLAAAWAGKTRLIDNIAVAQAQN